MTGRTWSLTIAGHPPSPNRTIGRHWSVRHAQAAPFRDAVAYQMRALRGPAATPEPHIFVRFSFEYTRRQYRDSDNAIASIKSAQDGLVLSGLIENDTQEHITFQVDQYKGTRKQLHIAVLALPRRGNSPEAREEISRFLFESNDAEHGLVDGVANR